MITDQQIEDTLDVAGWHIHDLEPGYKHAGVRSSVEQLSALVKTLRDERSQLQNELDSARAAIAHMQARVDSGFSNLP